MYIVHCTYNFIKYIIKKKIQLGIRTFEVGGVRIKLILDVLIAALIRLNQSHDFFLQIERIRIFGINLNRGFVCLH